MKKILFLLLICLIKLNAYEYLIYYSSGGSVKYQFYTDERGYLALKRVTNTGSSGFPSGSYYIYNSLNAIKTHAVNYIDSSQFDSYYRNDKQFLNDLYISSLFFMPFMNYLYNDSSFSRDNHIEYKNYELLYNSEGLVVESILNEKWAGLYSESEKSSSGYLYDSGGTLIYLNGEKVNWMQSTIEKITRNVIDNLYTLIHIISTPVGVCVSFVFVLCLAYFVVEVGRRAIKPIDDNLRKRNLNE